MSDAQVVIVGAVPAGVASAVALKDRGLRPVLLDQADDVASAWRTRYDRLRLNTCRPYSHLPGRSPEAFAGRRVLVVGPGCSGMEIAYDLAEGGAAKVRLSARTPPNIVLRAGPGGLPGDMVAVVLLHLPARFGDAFARFGRKRDLGDLTEFGLPVPEEAIMTRLHRTGQAPAIVDMEVIDAIKARRIEVVPGVESLDETGVQLTRGSRVEPDAVIAATGYSRVLKPLVGHLGVLDEREMPRVLAQKAAAPGLRFIGYVPRPGGLGYMGKEARRAAKAIARELSAA